MERKSYCPSLGSTILYSGRHHKNFKVLADGCDALTYLMFRCFSCFIAPKAILLSVRLIFSRRCFNRECPVRKIVPSRIFRLIR